MMPKTTSKTECLLLGNNGTIVEFPEIDNSISSLEQHMPSIIVSAILNNSDDFLNLMFSTVFSLYLNYFIL